MYYFCVKKNEFSNEAFITKYEVSLDIKRLKELKLEIIDLFSKITHQCYKTTKRPNQYDYEHIRNYKEEFIRVVEYHDLYVLPEDEYLVEYDYYEHHELVFLIDSLIRGETSSIDKIKNLMISSLDEETPLLEAKERVIKEMIRLSKTDISKQIEELVDIQRKLTDIRVNHKNDKNISILDYRDKVLDCVTLHLDSFIPLNDVLKVQDFFFDSKVSSMDSELVNVLKLELHL